MLMPVESTDTTSAHSAACSTQRPGKEKEKKNQNINVTYNLRVRNKLKAIQEHRKTSPNNLGK